MTRIDLSPLQPGCDATTTNGIFPGSRVVGSLSDQGEFIAAVHAAGRSRTVITVRRTVLFSVIITASGVAARVHIRSNIKGEEPESSYDLELGGHAVERTTFAEEPFEVEHPASGQEAVPDPRRRSSGARYVAVVYGQKVWANRPTWWAEDTATGHFHLISNYDGLKVQVLSTHHPVCGHCGGPWPCQQAVVDDNYRQIIERSRRTCSGCGEYMEEWPPQFSVQIDGQWVFHRECGYAMRNGSIPTVC